ncbi:MAG: rhomboid family intramembrane serine protease [Chloroflexi bacterium]|nr:MAG: rhomboid family intramembrane serine protease [Chloroflexota bacterium]
MIPLKDDNPVRSTPIVTIALVVVNVIVFLYEFQLGLQNGGGLDRFLNQYSFDFTAFTQSFSRGGLTLAAVVPLFTHMFLHANWLHVGGNMLYLWIFGNNVEDRLGSVRFIVFYLACGLAAAFGQGIVAPEPMIGASGAIAGVLAAYLVMFPGARVSTLIFLGLFITILQLPALLVIGFWIVTQLVSGLAELRMAGHPAGGVAYYAHIFGFVAGIPLLFVLRAGIRRTY